MIDSIVLNGCRGRRRQERPKLGVGHRQRQPCAGAARGRLRVVKASNAAGLTDRQDRRVALLMEGGRPPGASHEARCWRGCQCCWIGAVPAWVLVSRSVGGVLSGRSSPTSPWVIIHLSGRPVGAETEVSGDGQPHHLLLGLAPDGGCQLRRSPAALVRSYRTVSPLPVPGEPGHRRSVLCCPVREVTPA